MTDVAHAEKVAGLEIDRRSSDGERGLDWADVRGTNWGSVWTANASPHLTVPPWATLAAWIVRTFSITACSVLMCAMDDVIGNRTRDSHVPWDALMVIADEAQQGAVFVVAQLDIVTRGRHRLRDN